MRIYGDYAKYGDFQFLAKKLKNLIFKLNNLKKNKKKNHKKNKKKKQKTKTKQNKKKIKNK